METTIQIIGCGERKTGVGKNGKPYDFVNVHFTYENEYIEGKASGSFMCPGDKFEQYGLHVGSSVNVLLFFRNFNIDRVYVL